jgi:enoyl-CoA hydratase
MKQPMEFENIIYQKEEGIARLIINRPEKMNALNRATRMDMANALGDVRNDPSVKVLVVSGAGGKSFIAGSDLTELSTYSPLDMEQFMSTLAQSLYTQFEQLDKPVIAMIDGQCLGGGLEVAMACDIRIASDRSKFGQPEILIGIMPGGGGTQRLTRLVGAGKAKEMMFTGKPIDAAEALSIGLINRVCPVEELEQTVLSLAKSISKNSSLVLKWIKKSVNMAQETSLRTGLDYEALAECLLFTSQDHEEGMKAFFEKRKAVFTGR